MAWKYVWTIIKWDAGLAKCPNNKKGGGGQLFFLDETKGAFMSFASIPIWSPTPHQRMDPYFRLVWGERSLHAGHNSGHYNGLPNFLILVTERFLGLGKSLVAASPPAELACCGSSRDSASISFCTDAIRLGPCAILPVSVLFIICFFQVSLP